MELGFKHRNQWSKCVGEILRNFGKEKVEDVNASETSAEYKFNLASEFGLFNAILRFISENIELIDNKDLKEMQNFPSFLSDEKQATQSLDISILKSMVDEYLTKCTQDPVDEDKLEAIIKKIQELESKRYNEAPLILLAAEFLVDKHYFNAAIYILRSYDKKYNLTPSGHTKLSILLISDKNKFQFESKAIISYALLGLVEMTKNNNNDNAYRDEALKVLKQAINLLKGKDVTIDIPLSPA